MRPAAECNIRALAPVCFRHYSCSQIEQKISDNSAEKYMYVSGDKAAARGVKQEIAASSTTKTLHI